MLFCKALLVPSITLCVTVQLKGNLMYVLAGNEPACPLEVTHV